MRHLRTAAIVAATGLSVGVVMMVTGANAANVNSGTFNMKPGSALAVTCPNALTNANRLTNSETVNCAADTTTTTQASTTTTVAPTTTTPTTQPSTTTTVPSGGNCTNPGWSTSDPQGTDTIDSTWSVNNDAWSGSHGPQSLYVCDQTSWYAVSSQPNNGGAVETYPDSEYFTNSQKTVAQYQSITSTFAEQFPTDNSVDAAYDLWLNNFGIEVMIWNEDSGSNLYWNTQGSPVTIGGVDYQWANKNGPLVFIMKNQEKSGTVDILAVLNFLVSQGKISSTAVPGELEYGVEICSTPGSETFPLTGLTFNVS